MAAGDGFGTRTDRIERRSALPVRESRFTRSSHAVRRGRCKSLIHRGVMVDGLWVRFPSPAPFPASTGQQQPRHRAPAGAFGCPPSAARVVCSFHAVGAPVRDVLDLRTRRDSRRRALTAKSGPQSYARFARTGHRRLNLSIFEAPPDFVCHSSPRNTKSSAFTARVAEIGEMASVM